MKALVVSVDYAAELAVTLLRNAKHFDQIVVMSSYEDRATADVVKAVHNADLIVTDVFQRNEAWFAKDLATVEGLRFMGLGGWIMLLDADIMLPTDMSMLPLEIGNLYSPRRRMCASLSPDANWLQYPVQKDIVFAGYCQLFHSDDPNIQPWPNYPIASTISSILTCVERLTWYSDTIFQDRWPPEKKVRLPFDVLHIGDPPGLNWCGRSPEARAHLKELRSNPANFQWSSQWKVKPEVPTPPGIRPLPTRPTERPSSWRGG